ncbi:hypothetical protein SLEP1_g44576 [Rubroshorea leprosula]|uniref:Microtubule-associated protein Jupiter n=1 Tax=Rubroshorea leprosula TaxID=152421 RepID=A0AAV5LI68_9ROSI|nr:hypothetical protein SLEP1_g44576 [Rubroshorea leprosula]
MRVSVSKMFIRRHPNDNIPATNKAPAPNSNGAVKPVQTPTPTSGIPTGNINVGPGAGAYNTGGQSASINDNMGAINFNRRGQETVPPNGNLNKGPGAGGINSGTESASINGNQGIINF